MASPGTFCGGATVRFHKQERITAPGRPACERRRLFITSKADAPPAARGSRDGHPRSFLPAAFVQSWKAQSQETQGPFKVSQRPLKRGQQSQQPGDKAPRVSLQ